MRREELGIPQIAARAGVNPTTLYRRWGDVNAILSDVATERLRPTEPPPVTGSLQGDLAAWAELLFEELSSDPGRAMVIDLIAGDAEGANAGACAEYTSSSIQEILNRHTGPDNQGTPSLQDVRDYVLAPIYYQVLYVRNEPAEDYARHLVSTLFTLIYPHQDHPRESQ